MRLTEQKNIFNGWVDEYQGVLFRIIRGYAARLEDQEDLLQDILTQLWISVPSFNGKAKVSTWIYKVALNTALTWQRGQKKRRRTRISLSDIDEAADIRCDEKDGHADRRIIDQLYESIRQLPKIDASLILMHLDGLSYREIADVFGITENNVGVKLNRAKKQLGKLMKGLIDDI